MLRVIGRCYGTAEIGLISSAFEAAGLRLFVLDGATCQVLTSHATAMGGARLAVLEDEFRPAVELLQSLAPFQKSRLSLLTIILSVWGVLNAVPPPATGTYCRYRSVAAPPQT